MNARHQLTKVWEQTLETLGLEYREEPLIATDYDLEDLFEHLLKKNPHPRTVHEPR